MPKITTNMSRASRSFSTLPEQTTVDLFGSKNLYNQSYTILAEAVAHHRPLRPFHR